MKYIILTLCIIATEIIIVVLNNISQGNILGIGLGDYILKIIGLWQIYSVLYKHIFK